ncbi:serine/threonine protein kinase, partial [Pyxidicoccus sp. 3LG]
RVSSIGPAARKKDDDDALDRAISDSSRRTRRNMVARNVATLGLIVGLVAVVFVFRVPIFAVLNGRAADGQAVHVTINSNERVKVSVRHGPQCGSDQPVTELGFTPLTLTPGAHLQDTLILENEQQGIYKEDGELLAFGEMGQPKVHSYEFRRGDLQLTLKPNGLKGISVRRNGQDVGLYSGKDLKFNLYEGRHKLELNGGPLKEPFLFEVEIKPGIINKETQDLSAFLG